MENYFKVFDNDRFAKYNGIELIECNPGYAKAQVLINDKHLNSANVVHGGLLFTLADFAFAAAVNSYGNVTLSVHNSITYFQKSEKGLITAEAKEISKSNRLITCDIQLIDDQNILLASFKGTAYITKKTMNF